MKGFFKWFFGFLAAFGLIFLLIFIIVASLIETEPVVSDNSYLHLNLSGAISEYAAPDQLEEALGQADLDMKKIRDNLEKAAVDERINGVIVQISFLEVGYAKLQELREYISEFRKSGKKIYAYLGTELAFTKDYYVASACDSVFMPPSANLFLTGISSEVTFYKNFFKKFGVEAEFVHVGKYKNAPDTYTRDSMSPEQREVIENLLETYYRNIIQTIAVSRNMTIEAVEKLINEQSGFTGEEAMQFGLIDRTAFFSDVENELKMSDEQPKRLSGNAYARIPASSLKIRNKSRIAVINCVGTIFAGTDSDDPFFGKVLGASTIVGDIARAAESKSVKAIILRVDSPGGSATAAHAIYDAIQKARTKKPVIASVSDYGASGGYYISMAADTMITAPNSLVGSIGVFAGKFNVAGLYDKLELKNEQISRGKNAGLFSLMQPWSPSEKAVIERLIGNFYQDFVQKTADARDLTYQQVNAVAQGRVWTGDEAIKVGLFDAGGSFYSAVQAAKKLAKIDADESVRLIYYPREKSMLSQLFSAIHIGLNSLSGRDLFPLKKITERLEMIQNKALYLMPVRIEWK